VETASVDLRTAQACEAVGLPRATYYRVQEAKANPVVAPPRPTPPRALSAEERERVLEEARSDRFMDQAPAQIVSHLLDEGRYVCSTRTMYRILKEASEIRERRDQARHPVYKKPELLATGPNQVWSWDITKLLGPVKGVYFQLYVILDIFSRYVVGWTISMGESGSLARRLIHETCIKQSIQREDLTIHSDNGPSMTSTTVALLCGKLGITKTTSRPHVSNDNPFSESQFKTMKYMPAFPERFGSMEDARLFCVMFFGWYNSYHHHSGINMLTPASVHYGRAEEVLEARQKVLSMAYLNHPERFVRKPPSAGSTPKEVWINPPKSIPTADGGDAH
jgi:putative transposase